MKLLFDTNVILDVLIERDPFYQNSASCMAKVEKGDIEGWICGTTVTTLAYLLGKELKNCDMITHTESLLNMFNVSIISKQILFDSLHSGFVDYEDSVLHQSAVTSNLDGIISRNKKDFKKSELPVYTPKEFIAIWEQL